MRFARAGCAAAHGQRFGTLRSSPKFASQTCAARNSFTQQRRAAARRAFTVPKCTFALCAIVRTANSANSHGEFGEFARRRGTAAAPRRRGAAHSQHFWHAACIGSWQVHTISRFACMVCERHPTCAITVRITVHFYCSNYCITWDILGYPELSQHEGYPGLSWVMSG